MSWFCSVCKKSFSRKDSIMRIDIVLKCHKILLFSSPKTTTTTTTTFLLFSFLLLLLLISTGFPPPPRHFYCFSSSSSSSSSSFLLFFLLLLLLLLLLHDIIDKPVKLDILNEIPPQVNEIPQHFIHEIKTIAYEVT